MLTYGFRQGRVYAGWVVYVINLRIVIIKMSLARTGNAYFHYVPCYSALSCFAKNTATGTRGINYSTEFNCGIVTIEALRA